MWLCVCRLRARFKRRRDLAITHKIWGLRLDLVTTPCLMWFMKKHKNPSLIAIQLTVLKTMFRAQIAKFDPTRRESSKSPVMSSCRTSDIPRRQSTNRCYHRHAVILSSVFSSLQFAQFSRSLANPNPLLNHVNYISKPPYSSFTHSPLLQIESPQS